MRIPLPPGCDYIDRTGHCFSQHDEMMSVLLGLGIAGLLTVGMATFVYWALWRVGA